MSAIGSWDLQKGIVTLLRSSGTVTALLNGEATTLGIYDEVPQGTAFPYVVVGEGTETESPYFGQDAHEMVAHVECWTQDGETVASNSGATGYKQALAIADAVVDAIMAGTLSVDHYDAVVLRVEEVEKQRVAPTPDAVPNLRCVIPKFAILLESTA